MRYLLLLFLGLVTTPVFGYFYLEDVMDLSEQRKTGVYNLNHTQKQELEHWLNDKFALKVTKVEDTTQTGLTFELVLSGGSLVKLSDGSVWEISPSDVNKTSVWLIPFPIEIKSGNDPDYPFLLINENTGDSVRARRANLSKPAAPKPPGS